MGTRRLMPGGLQLRGWAQRCGQQRRTQAGCVREGWTAVHSNQEPENLVEPMGLFLPQGEGPCHSARTTWREYIGTLARLSSPEITPGRRR